MKHNWQTTERGGVDECAFEVETETTGHAGPRCTVCDFSFCTLCYPQGWEHRCPGPPPEGAEYDWTGDGTGIPPEEPKVRQR